MTDGGNLGQEPAQAGFSLLFPPGQRPDGLTVERVLAVDGTEPAPAAVVHRPDPAEGWLELLASGLSFDISALAPQSAAPTPTPRHVYGMDQSAVFAGFEAIHLAPGPHIAGGGRMIPVVRVMSGLVAALARLLGARGVIWHPAETLMDSGYFSRVVKRWLEGGAFPALGLTALAPGPEGGVATFGLSFFIGQEAWMLASPEAERSETNKLAFRAIDFLIRNGPLEPDRTCRWDGEEAIVMQASPDGRTVSIWRET